MSFKKTNTIEKKERKLKFFVSLFLIFVQFFFQKTLIAE